ncbi:hypothetical protein W822_05210 [Advenella kashmirensis W13003]|uniref:Uncharacterized protein n=1 Tax=Advenella kashmirensis W13003 TaxID=1424334 RepID=V8QZJ4_9BURK|nr:hypothetical protein W822_05210 [Advenella kashmirensis W13003]
MRDITTDMSDFRARPVAERGMLHVLHIYESLLQTV